MAMANPRICAFEIDISDGRLVTGEWRYGTSDLPQNSSRCWGLEYSEADAARGGFLLLFKSANHPVLTVKGFAQKRTAYRFGLEFGHFALSALLKAAVAAAFR